MFKLSSRKYRPKSAKWQRFRTWVADESLYVVATALCAGAALYGSYDALSGLARMVGWDHGAPLAVAVDALAVAAGWQWARSGAKGGRVHDFARTATLSTVALSVVLNVIFHLIKTKVVDVNEWWWITVAVGAVPALAVAVLLHLAGLRLAEVKAERAQSRTAPQPQPPERTPVPHSAAPQSAEQPQLPLRVVPPQSAPQPQPQPQAPTGAGTPGILRLRAMRALREEYEKTGRILSTPEVREAAECGERTAQNCIRDFKKEENVA